MATIASRWCRNNTSPIKNKRGVSWRKRGSEDAMANTFHRSIPASRGAWLAFSNREFSKTAVSGTRFLTRIPEEAMISVMRSLNTQSV